MSYYNQAGAQRGLSFALINEDTPKEDIQTMYHVALHSDDGSHIASYSFDDYKTFEDKVTHIKMNFRKKTTVEFGSIHELEKGVTVVDMTVVASAQFSKSEELTRDAIKRYTAKNIEQRIEEAAKLSHAELNKVPKQTSIPTPTLPKAEQEAEPSAPEEETEEYNPE